MFPDKKLNGAIMKYKIEGGIMPILRVELNEKEEIFSEAGVMSLMTSNIHIDSYVRGGMSAAIGRRFIGETFFMVKYNK